MNNSIESTFDSLFAVESLCTNSHDVSLSEIQFFTYFACLISLYDGNSVADWGYNFVNTTFGTPYSEQINNAWKDLKSNRSIIDSNEDGYYRLNTMGAVKLNLYKRMGEFQVRSKYLDTVKDVFSVLPDGVIKEALHNEPALRGAIVHKSATLLLDESSPALKALYIYFSMLKKAMIKFQPTSLVVPATVWVESLQTKNHI